MKNKRLAQFAIAGLLAALLLLSYGFYLDHSAPNVRASHEVLFNWLSLLFAPLSLMLRLTNPDLPMVASWQNAVFTLLTNALYYASICKTFQVLLGRLAEKSKTDPTIQRRASANSTRQGLRAPFLDMDKA